MRYKLLILLMSIVLVLNSCIYSDCDDSPRVNAAKASLRSIYDAAERFKLEVGEYPKVLEELENGPSDYEGNWSSMLVGGMSALKDPWGNKYFAIYDTDDELIIGCYGADGVNGGKGEFDRDLFYPDYYE